MNNEQAKEIRDFLINQSKENVTTDADAEIHNSNCEQEDFSKYYIGVDLAKGEDQQITYNVLRSREGKLIPTNVNRPNPLKEELTGLINDNKVDFGKSAVELCKERKDLELFRRQRELDDTRRVSIHDLDSSVQRRAVNKAVQFAFNYSETFSGEISKLIAKLNEEREARFRTMYAKYFDVPEDSLFTLEDLNRITKGVREMMDDTIYQQLVQGIWDATAHIKNLNLSIDETAIELEPTERNWYVDYGLSLHDLYGSALFGKMTMHGCASGRVVSSDIPCVESEIKLSDFDSPKVVCVGVPPRTSAKDVLEWHRMHDGKEGIIVIDSLATMYDEEERMRALSDSLVDKMTSMEELKNTIKKVNNKGKSKQGRSMFQSEVCPRGGTKTVKRKAHRR